MSKILLAAEVSKAYEAATDEKSKDAVAKQAIATIEEHEKGYLAKDEEIEKHKNALEASTGQVKELTDKLKVSEDDLAEATKNVGELGAQLDVQTKAPGAIVHITHNKKTYKVIGSKFQTADGEVEASELSKNKKLVAELIEKGSGILQEVTD